MSSYPVAEWIEGFARWQSCPLGRPRAPATVKTHAFYARRFLQLLEGGGAPALGAALMAEAARYARDRHPPAFQAIAAWRELLAWANCSGAERRLEPGGLPRFSCHETPRGSELERALGPPVRLLAAGIPPHALASMSALEARALRGASGNLEVKAALAALLAFGGHSASTSDPGPLLPREPGSRFPLAVTVVADLASRPGPTGAPRRWTKPAAVGDTGRLVLR